MTFLRALTPAAWYLIGLAVLTVVGLLYADRHLDRGEDHGPEDP